VRLGERERQLRVGAVDAVDDRLCDERRRCFDEFGETLERSDLDVDARGCENDAVGVMGTGVADVVVERSAELEPAAKLALVLRERPVAVTRALPRGLDIDIEDDHELVAQELADLGSLDCAAAEGENCRP
jgi:hypothetical protein